VEPVPWDGAGSEPYNNNIGEDPRLTDPENGDYRPLPGSPAIGYGCQTFPPEGFQPRHSPGIDRQRSASKGFLVDRATEVSGPIDQDTFWDADTVRVVGDITVEERVTLSIRPGVRVLFDDHYALYVSGTLRAVGTADSLVHMRSSHPELFAVDSTTAGSWFGIRFENTSATNDSSRLEYCLIEHCKAAGDSSRGAALFLTRFSKLRVANCIFRNNAADYGAVAYCSGFASPGITGCVMTENYAFVGGAVLFCVDSYPALTNNTMVGNEVRNVDEWFATGVLHNVFSKSRPVNCIIRENASNYFFGGQIHEGKPYYTIYSNIEDGYLGEGNFDTDPLFDGGEPHPFQLTDGSPCINAGTPVLDGLWLPSLDLAGSARVQLGRIDVGAYEWGSASSAPDPNLSASVLRLDASPNPFAAATSLSFAIPTSGRVRLAIFDVTGRKVASLIDDDLDPGPVTIRWDGTDTRGALLESGVYFCRISVNGREVTTGKVLLVD
jgi:hypothetical protein